MEEINQQIVSLGNQVTEISQKVQENASQIEQLDKKIIENQKDLKRLEEERGKDHEAVKLYKEATLILEMERASHTLRFRKVQKDKDVETTDLMEQALADVLDMEKSQMSQEIDQIYRVNSSFARKNKVPREVHVVFVRRKIKEDILRRLRENTLKINDQEITILKQTPWKIRDIRKQYFFLTNKLNENKFQMASPPGSFGDLANKKIQIRQSG
ncbi:hypothetical protein JRQ81_005593 [Phrynocephalus forsythii]|uniref:L1 transposable element RRM domain-containing protein n=1 Tax=Phrynocephalus forsythii TaxID=171643 RepID=A0A9Q0Y456_9SAUR|nr:hypothetical protein JRQ81_005593 [Phrynocephalus forsythii]